MYDDERSDRDDTLLEGTLPRPGYWTPLRVVLVILVLAAVIGVILRLARG